MLPVKFVNDFLARVLKKTNDVAGDHFCEQRIPFVYRGSCGTKMLRFFFRKVLAVDFYACPKDTGGFAEQIQKTSFGFFMDFLQFSLKFNLSLIEITHTFFFYSWSK